MAKKILPPKKASLKLPEQVLDLGAIPKANLRKLFFQFEVRVAGNGNKSFRLVAYPAYKYDGKWKLGDKITLQRKKNSKIYKLPMPITLGNLELKHADLKKLMEAENSNLTFTPYFFKKNPHAAYTITDGSGFTTVDANPTPPGNPE